MTEEDKHLLWDQKDSAFHKTFLKALEEYKGRILSEICQANSEQELFRLQGRLLGLQMACNVVQVFGVQRSKQQPIPV